MPRPRVSCETEIASCPATEFGGTELPLEHRSAQEVLAGWPNSHVLSPAGDTRPALRVHSAAHAFPAQEPVTGWLSMRGHSCALRPPPGEPGPEGRSAAGPHALCWHWGACACGCAMRGSWPGACSLSDQRPQDGSISVTPAPPGVSLLQVAQEAVLLQKNILEGSRHPQGLYFLWC